MAISTSEYNAVLARLTALENHINDLTTAINRVVSISEVQQLHTLLETQIADLTTTVTALQARVTAIEEEPLS